MSPTREQRLCWCFCAVLLQEILELSNVQRDDVITKLTDVLERSRGNG